MPTGACSCSFFPNGAPKQWTVTLSGLTDGTCAACDELNGSYVPDRDSSEQCLWSIALTSCTFEWIRLRILDVSGVAKIEVEVSGSTTPNPPGWRANFNECSSGSYTLTLYPEVLNAECNWPNTVSARPVFPALSDMSAWQNCVAGLQNGCTRTNNLDLLPMPFLGRGLPVGDGGGCGCGESVGSCGGDSCGCDGDGYSSFLPHPGVCPSCSCGETVAESFGNPALAQAASTARSWQQALKPKIPGTRAEDWGVNLSRGNLILSLAQPGSGPFDSRPILTYNSSACPTSRNECHFFPLND